MHFHAYLPTYWDHYGSSTIEAAIVETARAAATLGFEGIWVNDEIVMPVDDQGANIGDQPVIEPLITLASLIHAAPRLTLGTAVVVLPQRHPVLVAKQAAALHIMSGGRLILGVGIGWHSLEFRLLGADFTHRAAITDEAIELMQALWREPIATYDGRFHHLEPASQPPLPPGGGPPIWIGGNSPAAIRRAARYGSGWLPFIHSGDPFANKVDDFRAGVALLRELTEGQPCPTIANMLYLRIERPDEPAVVKSTTPGMPSAFAGNPDAVAEHIDGYRQAGLEHALLLFESEDVDDLLRQMQVFAEQVAPRFADAG